VGSSSGVKFVVISSAGPSQPISKSLRVEANCSVLPKGMRQSVAEVNSESRPGEIEATVARDSNFRTRPGSRRSVIGAGSLDLLISQYTERKEQAIFSAIWTLLEHVQQ